MRKFSFLFALFLFVWAVVWGAAAQTSGDAFVLDWQTGQIERVPVHLGINFTCRWSFVEGRI